jgi:uncharacterized protein (TIGR02453 family)
MSKRTTRAKAASPAFRGFSDKLISFFRGLDRNNTREWFAPRKELFETHVRAPMLLAAAAVNDAIKTFALDNAAPDPAKCLYRIYRDTRFSKDKTPYKTHVGAIYPCKGLAKHGGAGFYFGVSHKAVQIAGGVYEPGPEELAALRQAIAKDQARFLRLIEDPKVTKAMQALKGEKLARVPKGYERHADSPVADYLKRKAIYWYVELPPKTALSPRLINEVVTRFKLMTPAMQWMNDAILAARRTEDDPATPKRPDPMW